MTNKKEQLDRGIGLLPGEERRRSQRVIIVVPITLELTRDGEVIKVPAHTIAVNIHGAMAICHQSVDSETQVEIVNDQTKERTSARVTRSPRHSAEGFLIPLEFVKPFPLFWQISFPPTNWKPAEV